VAQLVWSPAALADLTEICNYIGRDSEHYARLFAQRIFSAVETLTLFPDAGRTVPEYERRDLRELLFQNYRIVYRVKEDEVQIAAVVHGSRLLSNVWESDEPPVARDKPASKPPRRRGR
jgi:toxin ParE1/3/4